MNRSDLPEPNEDGGSRRGKGANEENSTYSGEFGERNRNTPGRSPSELGLDPDEMRGQQIGRGDDERVGGASFHNPEPAGERQSPELDPRADLGDGGISESGGHSGGARGNAGRSDRGAGGPTGNTRGGPGEYKSTSRGNLENG